MNYPDIFKRGKFSIFVPMIKFSYQDLFNLILQHREELPQQLDILRREMRTASNHQWDNSYFLVSNSSGELFKFIFEMYNYLIIWDIHDFVVDKALIGSDHFLNKKELQRLLESMDLYSTGKIHCSGCRSIEEYVKINNHRYFAGIYCDNCWETKYKQKAMEENYN